jgi:eukaryotic-like serine/threonine-protein kinase
MGEETIFHQALQTPPGERAAFLDLACAGDLPLRRHIEALLLAHENPDSLLQPPSPGLESTISEPIAVERSGTVIGPYKLLEQIGEGGFGIVYMADQQAPVRRRVALKIIKPGMDTRHVLSRFKAELRALSLMDHPNIARALDAGSTDSGRPYFVMELVRGVPITDYCDQNNLPLHERLELFVQVCHAVQHAHQKGIIHRDIKPSNVLVTLQDGRPVPKVIDFGVAKAIDRQLTQETLFTRFAEMIGTPLYMSPEQAEMTSLDIDTRADIYSLGVLLYELLTGRTPFDKERLRKAAFDEIRRIIREEEPPKPSLRISTLGDMRTTVAARRHADPHRLSQLLRGDLDCIVMKALEKDRTRRYDTAGNFAADVLCYLSDRPVEACPPSSVYRFRKFARRNRVAIATAAVVLIALLLGTVVSATQAIRATRAEQLAEDRLHEETMARNDAERERTEADRQRALADQQRKVAQAGEFTARRYLYSAQMKLAEEAWERGHVGRVLELLNGQRPVAGQEDLRGFGWYYRWRLCHSDRMTLRGAHPVGSVAISPDGAVLASGDASAAVKLWDVATGKELAALTGLNASALSVVFSPDGRLLAAGLDNGIVRFWDMPSRQVRAAFVAHGARIRSVAFSSDGATVATASVDGTAKLWNIPHRALGAAPANPSVASLLAIYGIPVPPTHPDPRATLKGHKKAIERIAFSPDGKMIATASADRLVKLWDVVTGLERASLKGHNDTVSALAFSPDGKLLASGSDDTTVRLWDPRSAQELALLHGHSDWVECVAFSPDGRQLATCSADDTVRLWDVGTRSERATFKGHTDKVWSLAFATRRQNLGFRKPGWDCQGLGSGVGDPVCHSVRTQRTQLLRRVLCRRQAPGFG